MLVEEKGFSSTWCALAMVFSPCLSRKRQSWDLACDCDGLFPLPVEEKAIMGLGVRLRWPFLPACRRKVRLRAPWKCSRWPFLPACRRKGNSNPLLKALGSLGKRGCEHCLFEKYVFRLRFGIRWKTKLERNAPFSLKSSFSFELWSRFEDKTRTKRLRFS